MSKWVSIPSLAERAGMTRVGMWKSLVALNHKSGGKLLRRKSRTGRGGKFEVCLEVLAHLVEHDPVVAESEQDRRLDDLDMRVAALRSAFQAHKLQTRKELERHKEQLKALEQLSQATVQVLRAFGPNQSR